MFVWNAPKLYKNRFCNLDRAPDEEAEKALEASELGTADNF